MPSSPEKPLANGIPNGHAVPVQDSPFIGYIIAMHRKMVSSEQGIMGNGLRGAKVLNGFRCNWGVSWEDISTGLGTELKEMDKGFLLYQSLSVLGF